MHNFRINNCDTDSISFNKRDDAPFSPEEIAALIKQINDESPELIVWEDDGYFDTLIVFKAKNYVMYDPTNKDPKKRTVIKGSALKDSKKETACREFQREIIATILEKKFDYVNIYNKYVREAMNVTDIKRWSSKKSYTKKIDTSTRSNETKLKDAIAGTNYKEGDKFWVFFKEDKTQCLAENFTGEYDRLRMAEKVFKSAQIFKNVLDTKTLFPNYKIKKNKAALAAIL